MGTIFVNWKAQHWQEDQCPQTVLQNQCNLNWKPLVFVCKGNSKLILSLYENTKDVKQPKQFWEKTKLDGGDFVMYQLGQAERRFPESPSLCISGSGDPFFGL